MDIQLSLIRRRQGEFEASLSDSLANVQIGSKEQIRSRSGRDVRESEEKR